MLSRDDCLLYQRFVEDHQAYIYPLLGATMARGVRPGARIVDMGTGPGHLSVELAERTGAVVHAVDINPTMHELARALATRRGVVDRLRFDLEDVHRLTYPDAFADLVVSYSCFHHWADPVAGIAECWRILKPGGRLLLIDTNRDVEAALDVLRRAIPRADYFRFVEEAIGESWPQERVAEAARAAGVAGFTLTDFEFDEEALVECLDAIELPDGEPLPEGISMCWKMLADKGLDPELPDGESTRARSSR